MAALGSAASGGVGASRSFELFLLARSSRGATTMKVARLWFVLSAAADCRVTYPLRQPV